MQHHVAKPQDPLHNLPIGTALVIADEQYVVQFHHRRGTNLLNLSPTMDNLANRLIFIPFV